MAGIGLGRLLGREHASTPQSGVEAPRLLKRSLPRLYYCCCCCIVLLVLCLVCCVLCLVLWCDTLKNPPRVRSKRDRVHWQHAHMFLYMCA